MKIRYSASSQASPETPPNAIALMTSWLAVARGKNCSKTPAVSRPCMAKCMASSHHQTVSNRLARLPSRSTRMGTAHTMSAAQEKASTRLRETSHHNSGSAKSPNG